MRPSTATSTERPRAKKLRGHENEPRERDAYK